MTIWKLLMIVAICCSLNVSATLPRAVAQGVEILVSADRKIFPTSWLQSPIDAQASPLAELQHSGCVHRVREIVHKYPALVVDRNLSKVFIVGRLSFSGIQASGTNSRDCIFIAGGEHRDICSSTWFERVLHSEFSSILLRNHPKHFHRSAWLSANPAAFSYGDGGVQAVKNAQIGRLFDEELLASGFIGWYSQSSVENDFNAFAGQLMLGEPRLWAAAEQHAAIQTKLQLTIDFYQAVEPAMDAKFFQKLILVNQGSTTRVPAARNEN